MRPEDIFNKTVIIAPLDWGLGHATRCVSIIRQLLVQKNQIVFAGVQQQVEFIKKDFPTLKCEIIRGYEVNLDSTRSTYIQMISQFGKLKRVVKSEGKIAEDIAKKYQADIVISDNRYGFRASSTINILLTHQLQVPLPALKSFVNKIIRKHIESFHYCWIPDIENDSICGEMVKPALQIPKIFIGLLNRFEKGDIQIEYDYLIIVSGPEPERSRFIYQMKQLVDQTNKSVCFIAPTEIVGYNCAVNPSTKDLNELILKSNVIISRAGYTTIMEMLALEKKAILIPTKGQFEQEYLAQIISADHLDFNVLDAIKL